MSQGYEYAGQFVFGKVKIFSSSGNVIDISKLITAMNLYEDIYKTSITGDMVIADTNNIIMETPIIGQEFLGFKIHTPGLDEFALDYSKHVFAITKITSRVSPQPGVNVYGLSFSSSEGLRNQRVKVTKSYTNTIDAIVEDLLSSAKYINSKKTFFIEPTKGVRKIVVPYTNPFKLINQLKQEAISKKGDSPHYMFYENTLGIHFRSLDSMYAQKSIAEFHAGDGGSAPSLDDEVKRVFRYQISGSNDMLLNVTTGLLSSNMITHDIYRKEYKYNDFSYLLDFYENYRVNYDDGDKDNPIYNQAPIDEFDNNVSDFTDAKRYIHPTSTVINNSDAQHYTDKKTNPYSANNIPKTIMSRKSKVSELTQGQSILIETHGTTNLNAGSIVKFNVPIAGTDHSKSRNDVYLSGRYLIKSLRHMFDFTEKRHSCAMTLVKDSVSKELPLNDLAIEPKAESRGVISEFYS
tara:strand:- start:1021 stop:2412 length:1392 start_codon:yes stop_codon:yes gene_type:complete